LESLFHAQGRLISDISHELRSPLARLSVALGIARQHTPIEATVALDRIEREADRLNQMVERLLTLSRLEAASEPQQQVPVQLGEVLREAAADADFEARSRNCKVDVRQADDCTVSGNRNLLRSAIENVLRNAVQYTAPNTTVEVDLRCLADGPNRTAQIEVRDYGPGVPEDELQNLFRPFYRLDQSRERQTGGAGLGLAIAERAIKLHHGNLEARNVPGGGLLLRITLPAIPT